MAKEILSGALLAAVVVALVLWRRARRLARERDAWASRAEEEQLDNYRLICRAFDERKGRAKKGGVN